MRERDKVARGARKMVMRVRRRYARSRMSVVLEKTRVVRLKVRSRQSLRKSREDARLEPDLLGGGRELEAAFSWRGWIYSQE